MRMRRKKNREARLNICSDILIAEPIQNKGKWAQVFGNSNPIHIEIGCGKGKFITESATKNKEINYVAIELSVDVLITAMENIKEQEITNIRFISMDAFLLNKCFDNGECERIYINFCDPWHKKKQAKRRLTHNNFLSVYMYVLKENGELFFKTDNQMLFEFSLNEFCNFGLTLRNITLNLHNSGILDNIMTEYETKFVAEAMPIYRCEVNFLKYN